MKTTVLFLAVMAVASAQSFNSQGGAPGGGSFGGSPGGSFGGSPGDSFGAGGGGPPGGSFGGSPGGSFGGAPGGSFGAGGGRPGGSFAGNGGASGGSFGGSPPAPRNWGPQVYGAGANNLWATPPNPLVMQRAIAFAKTHPNILVRLDADGDVSLTDQYGEELDFD